MTAAAGRADVDVDVAVIGAGPAGLTAAATAAERGLTVAVFDEYPVAGGRLIGQLHRTADGWWSGRSEAARLAGAVERAAGARLHLGSGVYAVDDGGGGDAGYRVHVQGVAEGLAARTLVVATGATEVPLPLPGWTLPGVLAVGAAQTLANVWGVAPGRRGMIVGLSPLAFAVAQELAWAGAPAAAVVAAVDGAARSHLPPVERQWAALFAERRNAPPWARPGAALLARPGSRRALVPLLSRAGLPMFGTRVRLNVAAEAIVGDERVEGVRLRRLDGDGRPVGAAWVERVDHVLLAGGLRPVPDLLRALGARTARVDALGGEVAVVDADGATTRPGVFAAGNVLGVEGAAVAAAQGRRAGLAAAARLGRASAADLAQARAAVGIARARAPLSFQPGVAAGHDQVAALWRQHEGGEA